ncbi:radical SAM protein [Streptomyces sp. NP160]|uniref:Rv2578c family radical SAM protein n=1 Tax=Streptomyces sp. NP160 TaxID=2586637 RepID=UPI001118808D|nr:radical SAM protein [Streptomyces sp. NP160]
MRWSGQAVAGQDEGALVGAASVPGLLRTTTTPEFAGLTFHEVLAKSALSQVPAMSAMPFRWTVNPYRGCSHSCTYCYARYTHSYLDLDTGEGFDREIVVKTNVGERLAVELGKPSWNREHVVLGTGTDPYQRAEGRYRLMPRVVEALHRSGTPFSVLTKGTLLRRDLPLLADAARDVPVGVGVSIAVWDDELHRSLEHGAPTPRARLDLVRAVRAAGLPCGVFLAPVLPHLTDSAEQLDAALADVAAAGATGVTVVPLHLRPGAREHVARWVGRHRPDLVPAYRELYRRGAYVPRGYREALAARLAPLLEQHGFAASTSGELREGAWPEGSLPLTAPPSSSSSRAVMTTTGAEPAPTLF